MTRASSPGVTARAVSGVVLAIAMLSPAVRAQEDRDAAFKSGLDARQDRKWQDAATHMRRAIEANPRESTRKVSRGLERLTRGGTEYLPYYFLGEALFNLGDCAGAVDAWSTSQQQGAVTSRTDYVAVLEKGYVACEAKGVLLPARFDPLLSRTRQQLTDVTSQATAVSERGKADLSLWRADTSLREEYDRAATELQAAQARLAVATRTRIERDFNDASAAGDRARTILVALAGDFDAATKREQSVQGLATEIDQALQTALEHDRTIDGKKAFLTPGLAAARTSASEAVTRARSQLNSNVSAVEQVAQLAGQVRQELDGIIGWFGPVTIIDRGVRPELAEGARAFFAGEYERALETLDPARLTDIPLQVHLHLFRAAALYALYVRSAEKDEARRAAALAEMARCKELSPTFQPSMKAFAPRFISFFENGV